MSAKAVAKGKVTSNLPSRVGGKTGAKTESGARKLKKATEGEMVSLAPGYAVVVTSIKNRAQRAKTVSALVKALGGPLTVGRALKIDHSSVSQWTRVGFLPAARVPKISELFDLPANFLKKFTNDSDD